MKTKLAILLTIVSIILMLVAVANAQDSNSVGCDFFNNLSDAVLTSGAYDKPFNAGETFYIDITNPNQTTGAELRVNGALVSTTSLPGRLSYTFPSTGDFLIQFTVITPGFANFDWGCTPSGPSEISVNIDIKPGSDPNCFNNNGNGIIPVAILGSNNFDVTQIDPNTVQLAGLSVRAVGKKGNLQASYSDTDGDNFTDLVVQIADEDGTFDVGNGTATVTGSLYDGTPIVGSDSICVTQ